MTCFLRDICLIWWFWSLCPPITRNVYKASGVPDLSWISTRSWKVIPASTCCEGSGDEGQLFAASGSRRCLNCTKVATASCPNEQTEGKNNIPWERRKPQIVQSGLHKNTEMSTRTYFQRKPELLTCTVSRWNCSLKKSKYRICYILTYSCILIQYLELDSFSNKSR